MEIEKPRARVPGPAIAAVARAVSHRFPVADVQRRLEETGGGYEVVHASPGLEVGVFVLAAPEPDRQLPHADDEVYVVLCGRGCLEVEGERLELHEGDAAFIPAGAEHHWEGYEQLALLVLFARTDPETEEAPQ